MPDDFDLLVIGGGTAGLVAAAGAASLGARVALLERHRLGGECLWTGCVPSKALIGSARLAHEIGRTGAYGLPSVPVAPDGREVLESVRAARARVQPHDDPERFREMGVHVVEGAEARFLRDGSVEADGRRWRARKVLVATGTRPAVPPVEGLPEAGFLTHEDAFDREELPGSAVVLGAGAVGVEFAQAYRRLGVEVTLVEAEERILPREDPELTGLLREMLEEEGVRVLTGRRAVRSGSEGGERTLRLERSGDAVAGEGGGDDPGEGETLRAEEILVAAGRRPNVEALALEEAGIEVGPEGVRVDGKLRTTRPGVFAAGDVIGGALFTHVADHEARTVVRNALFPFAAEVDYSVVPHAIYSDPELAAVGLSEAEARERHGDRVSVHRYDLEGLDRAIVDRQARGRIKVVAGPGGELLGVQMLAQQAGTLVVEAALALRLGADVTDLADLVHPYPTLSEGLRRAAQEAYRARLTPVAERWLDRWFRLARRLGL